MPTISQLPTTTTLSNTDQIPVSQGGISRATTVQTLLQGTQPALTLAAGSLLGRAGPGPGGPESIALGIGLSISDDVLSVDYTTYPQAGALDTSSQMLLNGGTGVPQLMPVSLLRGLYSAGQNVAIDGNGVISSVPSPATGSSIGAVAVGEALVINASGQLSVNIGTVSGTAAAGNDSRITGAEQVANKDQPNGYCGLDGTGLVPTSLLPTFASSPVQSVNGQTGAVVLTAGNISGLGSVASQDANAVDLTGGTISGANGSGMPVTPSLIGALPRTLAAHFTDFVNVNDFGLARNGTTDDSAAFINACQAAISSQKKVYIPSGGPILLTDAAQQNLSNVCIVGDKIRDYDGPQGYGHEGSCLWFTGTTKSPFLLGPNVHFEGLNFFWPNQTEAATGSNNGQPIVYPPLFAMQSPAQNIAYFNFVDCQVTNCYDFFTATSTSAVVGACTVEHCIIYAIHNCFTFTNNPEVFFIANCLFTWGVYGSVVNVGPTYNLITFTNTQGTWMKVVGNGTASSSSSTTVGGIMSSNNYVYGSSRGLWLAAGTLDISNFVDTCFDTVPTTLQGDPGCAIFSTRFVGGAWYPIYYSSTVTTATTAIQINSPAPGGIGTNLSFQGITVPFVNGSLVSAIGGNISNLSFVDIRCNALGHTTGGSGPYYGFQINTPNANVRIHACDLQATFGGLSNTGVQITACSETTVSNCVFRNLSAPIDIETSSGQVTLIGNTTQSTQGSSPIIGIGGANVRDLGNTWDMVDFTYNGFAPNNYRPGATIGIMPVACSSAAGYVGVQPSASGSGGGTRFGVTALGSSPVSFLTNAFNEEQLRVNRQQSAVNYVTVRGSVTGGTAQISTAGGDANSPLQVCGLTTGATYLGSAGASGSPVVRLGANADQSYVLSAPANGFQINLPVNCSTLLLRPGATLASGTVVLPAAIADGQMIAIWSSRSINALTVSGAAGSTVNNGSSFQLAANASVVFMWNAANATWFQSLGGGEAEGSIAGQNANAVEITGGSVTGLAQLGVGTSSATSASLIVDALAGYGRQVVYQSAGVPRWVAGAEGTPENNLTAATSASVAQGATTLPMVSTAGLSVGMLASAAGVAAGSTVIAVGGGAVTLSQPVTAAISAGAAIFFYTNQGSDFALLPYDDTGSPLSGSVGQPLTITRASGTVTIKTLVASGTANAPTPTPGDNSTQVATTAFVSEALSTTAVPKSAVGAPSGVAALDSTGHIPVGQLPAAAQGALKYQGAWNAATNTPALSSGVGTLGAYYTVSVAGSTQIDGLDQWNAGDHAAFNGTVWEKLDGLANEVISVAGRSGAVVLETSDIGGLGSIATQSSNGVTVSGGTIDGTQIGGTVPAAGAFTSLSVGASFTLGAATLSVPSYAGVQIQGGATILGAARGLGAFDGQQYRASSTQVASGQYAVAFGTGNTAAAPGCIVAGGSNSVTGTTGYAGAFGGSNSVTASYSFAFGNSHTLAGNYTHAFGFRARDFGRYAISLLAGGDNVNNGDAQRGETVLRGVSTAATAMRLTADGATAGAANTLNLQNDQVAKLNVEIVGYNSAGNAAACWYARDLLLARGASAATTALSSTTLSAGGSIGTVSGWTPPAIAADTTNGGLAVSSGYNTATTIKWVARVISLEVM